MNLVTQISRGYGRHKDVALGLARKLQDIGINVTHPLSDGSFVINEDTTPWSKYEIQLSYYQSIADSDFHIICNGTDSAKGNIDIDTSREIVYAMYKQKPVVLLNPPSFGQRSLYFAQRLIENHLSQIMVCDLTILDKSDTKRLVRDLVKRPVSYMLSNQDRANINNFVQEYFRELVTTSGAKL